MVCADLLRRVLRIVAQLMGRDHDQADALRDGDFGHGQRFLHPGRTVVQVGKQMAMDIDQWRKVVHVIKVKSGGNAAI